MKKHIESALKMDYADCGNTAHLKETCMDLIMVGADVFRAWYPYQREETML